MSYVSVAKLFCNDHVGKLVEAESKGVISSVVFFDAGSVLHPDLTPRGLLVRVRVVLAVHALPSTPLFQRARTYHPHNSEEN